jgi:hypothetical protein
VRLHVSGELTLLMEARDVEPGPLDVDAAELPPQP